LWLHLLLDLSLELRVLLLRYLLNDRRNGLLLGLWRFSHLLGNLELSLLLSGLLKLALLLEGLVRLRGRRLKSDLLGLLLRNLLIYGLHHSLLLGLWSLDHLAEVCDRQWCLNLTLLALGRLLIVEIGGWQGLVAAVAWVC
jgi:hypothetical protein